MPVSSVPFCSAPRCPNRAHGLCRQHRAQRHQATNARRGSTDAQGYTRHWKKFVIAFRALLLERHVIPACGARLAPGPSPDSACARQGRQVFEDLHCDHQPPLQPDERQNPERVCDPARVQLLCRACHSVKTRREQRQ